jgi:hypothetical protein
MLQQEVDDRGLSGVDPREVARVAVHAIFGAYMIADELGTLGTLPADIARVWSLLRLSFARP